MPPLNDLQNSGNTTTGDGDQSLSTSTHEPDPVTHPDLPPESFWVSASDELDWLDRNTFIQRKGSIKFAITKNSDPNLKPSHRSLSFNNKKPKASIIGPPKSQKFSHAGNTKPRQTDNRKLFRSRSESGKDRVHQATEPGSPRVSCMGRVGSTKCRRKGTGFWATVRAAFVSQAEKK